jgi:hypothetical protein
MDVRDMLEKLQYSKNKAIADVAKRILSSSNFDAQVKKELQWAGGFLAAVLKGNYEDALRKADGMNRKALTEYGTYKPPRKHYDMHGKIVYVNFYLVDTENKRILDKQMQRADTIKYLNQKIAGKGQKWMRWDAAKQYAKNPNATFKEEKMRKIKLIELIDNVPGGKGDKTDPKSVDANELAVGKKVEREHTDSDEKAEEIALDHLTENPKYYSELVSSGIVDEKDALELAKKLGVGQVKEAKEDFHKFYPYTIAYDKSDDHYEVYHQNTGATIYAGRGLAGKKKAKEIIKKKLNIHEKAVSKAQQQAAGIAYAAKKGEIPKSKLKGASKQMAKMGTKELKKFAKTKHSGLPQHVKEATDNLIGKKFKAFQPIRATAPGRGVDFTEVEGVVKKVDGDKITIEDSLKHIYIINKKDFLTKNKFKNEIKEAENNMNNMKMGNLINKDSVKEEEEIPQLTLEDKKCFLEDIKKLEEYGQKLYSPVDLVELAEKLSGLGKMAERVALEETEGWFDKVTINRNMKEVRKVSEDITKTATEAKSVQQRLTSLYEDLKHVLGRYFEIASLDASGKPMVEDDLYNPAGQNTSFDYLKSNFEDFKNADKANKDRINKAKRNIS